MFKIQRKLQSMDINKNMEKYKFNSPYTINTTKLSSNKIKDFNKYYENPRENTINRKNKFPPIFFYRKINTPYKYNISSVPEYLIKTNEEKRFIDKLYKSLTSEKDKTILKDLLDKNKKKITFRKDIYKPKYIDVQKLLKYKPILYSKISDPLDKNKTIIDRNENTLELPNSKYNENDMVVKSTPNDETLLINEEKIQKTIDNENKNNNNDNFIDNEKSINIKNDEITKEAQTKFKYKLSDIFNFRKEPVFLNKSAEKYLFKRYNDQNSFLYTTPNMTYNNTMNNENKENNFYTSSESKSDWIPNKINNKKMGTNSSVSYNILCPMYRGTNKFVTATELNKNNLYNESPAFRRVKSISEFIDLTRVSATNTLGCFDRKMKIPNFRFNNSIGTNQLDAYHINRDLIEKPI